MSVLKKIFLSKKLKFHLLNNEENTDNIPIDTELLIIQCKIKKDLLNLPITLQYIFINHEDISIPSDDIKENINTEIISINHSDNTIIFNHTDRFLDREGSYFNYVQSYNYSTNIYPSGTNIYSFPLYPEESQKYTTIQIKVPFGCEVYKSNNLLVDFDGIIKVKL